MLACRFTLEKSLLCQQEKRKKKEEIDLAQHTAILILFTRILYNVTEVDVAIVYSTS
jgi:hypothetical protein